MIMNRREHMSISQKYYATKSTRWKTFHYQLNFQFGGWRYWLRSKRRANTYSLINRPPKRSTQILLFVFVNDRDSFRRFLGFVKASKKKKSTRKKLFIFIVTKLVKLHSIKQMIARSRKTPTSRRESSISARRRYAIIGIMIHSSVLLQ